MGGEIYFVALCATSGGAVAVSDSYCCGWAYIGVSWKPVTLWYTDRKITRNQPQTT